MNETNWDDLRLFLAVARSRGLAGAASETGVSRPTLSRRLIALEHRLGAELFRRHARGYDLTEEGQRFLAQVERAEGEITPLLLKTERPLVKISAGSWVTWLLCRNANSIDRRQVRLRFIAVDHRLDIARREAVIGVRNARPEQVGLAARQVGEVQFAIYGAHDLPWAAVQGPTPSASWVASQDGPRIEVSHPRSALDLVLAGVARAVLPVFVGHGMPDLGAGVVIPELTHGQWLVSHGEARHETSVRSVLKDVGRVLQAVGQ